MNKLIERLQVTAIDTQKIIGFSGHGPGRGDFWAGTDQTAKALRLFWSVTAKIHMDKTLHGQSQFCRIELGAIGLDVSLCLKPLAPPPGLTGDRLSNSPSSCAVRWAFFCKAASSFVSVVSSMCGGFLYFGNSARDMRANKVNTCELCAKYAFDLRYCGCEQKSSPHPATIGGNHHGSISAQRPKISDQR